MYEDIKEQIRLHNLMLFIGSGVPATLGLPTWKKLIDKLAEDLEYDADIFVQHGDYLTLAEYYKNQRGSLEELRAWMSKEWAVEKEKIEASAIYSFITRLGCHLIYTTNYDHTLEQAFEDKGLSYRRVLDVGDFINLTGSCTQIIKFHGDLDPGTSIVLTEEDYFNRLDFESPLDIKLRADMLGKSILFLGYSLSDINIRLLIYKLDKLWRSSNTETNLRPRSYIFLPSPNPVQEDIFTQRGIIPIIGNDLDATKSLECFLQAICE